MPFFSLFIPPQAVGANLVYWDLFNAAGSTKRVLVHSVVPVVSGIAAVVASSPIASPTSSSVLIPVESINCSARRIAYNSKGPFVTSPDESLIVRRPITSTRKSRLSRSKGVDRNWIPRCAQCLANASCMAGVSSLHARGP